MYEPKALLLLCAALNTAAAAQPSREATTHGATQHQPMPGMKDQPA